MSWLKVILHGLIPVGLLILLGATFSALQLVKDPERFSEGVVRSSFFMLFLGMGASYLAQKGKRLAAWILSGLIAVIILSFVGIMIYLKSQSYKTEPLTSEESAPLIQKEKNGRIFIEHPYLGFYVHHPGPEFQQSNEIENYLASVLGDLPRIKVYAYRNPNEPGMFAILLYKGMDPSRKEFEEMIKGFHKGLSEHTPSTVNIENRVWETDRKEWTTHIIMPMGSHIRTRFLLKALGPRKIPFVVILITSSLDPERLKDIIDSFGP